MILGSLIKNTVNEALADLGLYGKIIYGRNLHSSTFSFKYNICW